MKPLKDLLIIILSVFVLSCNEAVHNKTENEKPVILIENNAFDFGQVLRGEVLAHSFIVKNKGEGELVISKVEADCGCTIVDFKSEPIEPGSETNIDVLFDSQGMVGLQIKKMKVYSNANIEPVELLISATIQYPIIEGI